MSVDPAFLLHDEVWIRLAWRSIREKSGVTQEEVAVALGVSLSTVKRMEAGLSPISAVQLVHMLSRCEYRLAALPATSQSLPVGIARPNE